MSSEGERTVDELLKKDLNLLTNLTNKQLNELINCIIHFLIDTKGTELQDKLSVFSETYGIGGSPLKTMVRSSLLFLQRGVRGGWLTDQMRSACEGMGLNAECSEVIASCWDQHSSNLSSSLLSKMVSANQLMDVDWIFGVTAASDDSDQVI